MNRSHCTYLLPRPSLHLALECSPSLLTLMAVFPYLLGVGLVLLLHSFRSRATSWVTPTHVMSSLICWYHVFLGRPRRLVPGIASSITLRVTLSASRLWTCPNQRRRPPRITSSIGETCSSSGSEIPICSQSICSEI